MRVPKKIFHFVKKFPGRRAAGKKHLGRVIIRDNAPYSLIKYESLSSQLDLLIKLQGKSPELLDEKFYYAQKRKFIVDYFYLMYRKIKPVLYRWKFQYFKNISINLTREFIDHIPVLSTFTKTKKKKERKLMNSLLEEKKIYYAT